MMKERVADPCHLPGLKERICDMRIDDVVAGLAPRVERERPGHGNREEYANRGDCNELDETT